MDLSGLAGRDLGTRVHTYTERDVILYALAVGAPATELELVFERDLRVLPTFGLTLGLWAPDMLGQLGAIDPRTALHGAQSLRVHRALPVTGTIETAATVTNVWDKGRAAVLDVDVRCAYFTATYSIFAPDRGGFGGPRGPSARPGPDTEPVLRTTVPTFAEQAALYRLTGDHHHIHIDPEAALAIGAPRPILHGLCTLATAIRGLARAVGAHPADLTELHARFAAPVLPGQELRIRVWPSGEFAVSADGSDAMTGGHARFSGGVQGSGLPLHRDQLDELA